jgi:hypothetical protein
MDQIVDTEQGPTTMGMNKSTTRLSKAAHIQSAGQIGQGNRPSGQSMGKAS